MIFSHFDSPHRLLRFKAYQQLHSISTLFPRPSQLHSSSTFVNLLYYIIYIRMARTFYLLSLLVLTLPCLNVKASVVPFGTVFDPFPQVQAQAACLALPFSKPGWRSAIPRRCSGHATCETICKSLPLHAPDAQRRGAKYHTCLNSFHVYNQGFSKKEHAAGLKTYNYNSCKSAGCGPNFCCCVSYN